MSHILLDENRSTDTEYLYPIDHDLEYDDQHHQDMDMADFLIAIICEYSVGAAFEQPHDMFETNFTHHIHNYADKYRCDRYQFIKNQRFIHDVYTLSECKRATVSKCKLFINGFISFDDLVEFVNWWGRGRDRCLGE